MQLKPERLSCYFQADKKRNWTQAELQCLAGERQRVVFNWPVLNMQDEMRLQQAVNSIKRRDQMWR